MAYRTVADADTYFADQLFATDWTGASAGDKQLALNMASAAIDKLRYKGAKNTLYTALVAAGGDTSLTVDQMLARTTLTQKEIDDANAAQATQFPRDGAADIPDQAFWAVCEEARELLSGRDPQQEHRNMEITSENIGGQQASFAVSGSFLSKSPPQHTIHQIVSPRAWQYLVPFLARDNDSFQVKSS
jgi:hypothetical protein